MKDGLALFTWVIADREAGFSILFFSETMNFLCSIKI